MNKDQHFDELFQKYLNNTCTPEEAEQLLQWLGNSVYTPDQTNAIQQLLASAVKQDQDTSRELEKRLMKNFPQMLNKVEEPPARRLISFPKRWYRIVAAAAIILLLAGGGRYIRLHYAIQPQISVVAEKQEPPQNDILPGGNKAVLTLADGRQVVLDETQDGDITQQGNTRIIKLDGQLTYNEKGNSQEVVYNTIRTPNGGQYQLILADGSKIWLNAASSLRFPTSFPGKKRVVELNGEGYFEVASNDAQPFSVKVNNMEVVVLGTHFNIMAYDDEKAVKTTLLEGSVKINTGKQSSTLEPGQQARWENESIRIVNNVDMDEVVAWKNGYFHFGKMTSLKEVMRQIARWYDVEISYEGDIAERRFGGKISRDNNASEILKVLELSKVHFKIENKRIVVTR